MGKKRKIFILSAIVAGIAIFFGRKRMKAKSEEVVSGDWTPDTDEIAGEAVASGTAVVEDAESSAEDDSSSAEDDSSEAAEKKTAETTD